MGAWIIVDTNVTSEVSRCRLAEGVGVRRCRHAEGVGVDLLKA